MRRLLVFENLSLDGFFADAGGSIGFAKNPQADPEFDAFVAQNAGGSGVLLFGRITYEMMADFWPTAAARQMLPDVAEGMNAREKIVFSRTLREAPWNNTTLISDDAVSYVRGLKAQPGPDLAVLGSGQIVSQLAQMRLVDEYQFVIAPVAIGHGRTLFETLGAALPLHLTNVRRFNNGNLFLSYEGGHDAADHSVYLV